MSWVRPERISLPMITTHAVTVFGFEGVFINTCMACSLKREPLDKFRKLRANETCSEVPELGAKCELAHADPGGMLTDIKSPSFSELVPKKMLGTFRFSCGPHHRFKFPADTRELVHGFS